MPPAKNSLQKLLDLTGKFVTRRKGVWDHQEWESLLEEVPLLGYDLNDETKRNLGNILEASKYFYEAMPTPSPRKKSVKKKK